MAVVGIPTQSVQRNYTGAVTTKSKDVLPQASVLLFDPKKRFKVQPAKYIRVGCNQGGHDALDFDSDKVKVIFVQVTRSDKHDLKILYASFTKCYSN
ncbi:unnamed protein product [Phytophthora fragariaefolia]|uniref:Unnamed protein product n=1 Tax=Phytophthora fragariaefolia TaxID=1490495 RepID=A0A9W6X709_9STRA|nr:unnamed protein product [Phytophthora fragariaefolia]